MLEVWILSVAAPEGVVTTSMSHHHDGDRVEVVVWTIVVAVMAVGATRAAIEMEQERTAVGEEEPDVRVGSVTDVRAVLVTAETTAVTVAAMEAATDFRDANVVPFRRSCALQA